uniref:UDP-glucuronosyltransferase n=1 Tax=Globodera rostochiensis TaxID=31243 RepID=A0A914HWI0_GLORO
MDGLFFNLIRSLFYDIFAVREGTPLLPFRDRLINFYNSFYNWAFLYDLQDLLEEPIVRHAFGNDFPKMKEIGRNISLLFVNSNQFFEYPRPISNKVINVGGMVEMAQKQLTRKSAAYWTMPNPAPFLYHLERDAKLFAKHKNVHPVTWADQKTILLHPKTRAFVSHCGLNSLTESVRAGVPILAIPLFGDQKYNAILAEHKGVGIKLDVKALKAVGAEALFFASLGKLLNDPSYRRNAQMIKRKFELTPFGPKQTLIQWVEFAAEFAELNELNLPGEDELGTLAYYSIDVLLFSAFVVAVHMSSNWCKNNLNFDFPLNLL